MVGVDLEFVDCDFWVDSGHVFIGPGEAIVVLREELDECEPEVQAEPCSDLHFVVWIVWMDADIVEFVYARPIWIWLVDRGRL